MPRQKPKPLIPEIIEEAPLAIPGAPSHREHERHIDPYKTLPGAVPEQQAVPKRQAPRAHDENANYLADQRQRLERYDRYLDSLVDFHGDIDKALSIVYRVSVEQATERHDELLTDVQTGIGSSSISEIIKRRDVSRGALLSLLRKWAYCGNPAASLKAIDMLRDLGDDGPSESSFEQYARLALMERE